MNKRKLLTLALSLCMVAILAIGGTLAYFTDYESAKNEFVVGNVDIVLNEDFDEDDPLVPTDEPEKNYVKKEVTITNAGDSDAYVRLLIAYEDTKDVGLMAWMGFNHPYGVMGKIGDEDKYVIPTANNDFLQIKDEDGTVYTVAYVTLSEAVAKGATTDTILAGVAIKGGADNAWAQIVGDKYDVLVLAQGAQVIDTKSATDSIDTAFGFKMDNTADAKVAQMFTEAGLGNFTAHDYTSEGAWSSKTIWDAISPDVEEIL